VSGPASAGPLDLPTKQELPRRAPAAQEFPRVRDSKPGAATGRTVTWMYQVSILPL
jgi:hypothetical protein